MKAKQRMFVMVGVLLLLSGCAIDNVTEFADTTFYQSQKYTEDSQIIKRYVKGLRLYDQFETIAIFDALWNSDEMRTLYARLYGTKMGKNEEDQLAFLRRQLSANLYTISFYVLSMKEISLTTTPHVWVMYLEVDGKRYLPTDIKIAEPPAEYIQFFGKRMSNHKQVYELFFDRKDAEGVDVLANAKTVKLFFSSPRYFGSVGWELDTKGNALDTVVLDKKPVETKPAVTKKQRSLERHYKQRMQEAQNASQTQEEQKPPALGKRARYTA